jgi:hypothetical protein
MSFSRDSSRLCEIGDEQIIGAYFELIQIHPAIAGEVRDRSLILADVGTVDEAERRRKVLADLLEDEIRPPGFVRKVQRKGCGIVVPGLLEKLRS